MSIETTAALYGAISGAVATGIVTGIISVIRHLMRRRGGIEFIPSNWRFAYLVYPIYVEDQGADGSTYTKPEYRLYEPSYPFDYEGEPTQAVYAFTIDLLNKMDVADTLRDVSVAFMRNGQTMFTHKPFDEDNTTDRTPIVFEIPPNRTTSYELPEWYPPPEHGIESIGVIALPAHDSRRIKLKGYVIDYSSPGGDDPRLRYLKSGCDEVRFRAERENGKPFDERIVHQDTAPQSL